MKNSKQNWKSYLTLSLLLISIVCIYSCSKMDAYKNFAKTGEIVYPGIFDSLKVVPGRNRALITGLMISDPKVVKYRVFWNGGLDSLEANLVRSGGVDTLHQIVPDLPEGPITFEIRTYDKEGNVSIPMSTTGNIYGSDFQSSIELYGNRQALSSILNTDGTTVTVSWSDIESYQNIIGMKVHYFDFADMARDTVILANGIGQISQIRNANVQKPITYNTLFLPDGGGIDTLQVGVASIPRVAEVALLNNKIPVANSSNDGSRWAILRDWTSNDAIKSHSGYGGCDISGNIYFSAGWGGPSITNGKIYQVITLPPGKYSFDAPVNWWYVSNYNNNRAYLVAATGSNGIPDESQLNSSIGYKMVDNGSDVKLSFTLTQMTTLSIGCLINFADDGEELQFKSLRLYIDNQ